MLSDPETMPEAPTKEKEMHRSQRPIGSAEQRKAPTEPRLIEPMLNSG
jgi:hypothetical protein